MENGHGGTDTGLPQPRTRKAVKKQTNRRAARETGDRARCTRVPVGCLFLKGFLDAEVGQKEPCGGQVHHHHLQRACPSAGCEAYSGPVPAPSEMRINEFFHLILV